MNLNTLSARYATFADRVQSPGESGERGRERERGGERERGEGECIRKQKRESRHPHTHIHTHKHTHTHKNTHHLSTSLDLSHVIQSRLPCSCAHLVADCFFPIDATVYPQQHQRRKTMVSLCGIQPCPCPRLCQPDILQLKHPRSIWRRCVFLFLSSPHSSSLLAALDTACCQAGADGSFVCPRTRIYPATPHFLPSLTSQMHLVTLSGRWARWIGCLAPSCSLFQTQGPLLIR